MRFSASRSDDNTKNKHLLRRLYNLCVMIDLNAFLVGKIGTIPNFDTMVKIQDTDKMGALIITEADKDFSDFVMARDFVEARVCALRQVQFSLLPYSKKIVLTSHDMVDIL